MAIKDTKRVKKVLNWDDLRRSAAASSFTFSGITIGKTPTIPDDEKLFVDSSAPKKKTKRSASIKPAKRA